MSMASSPQPQQSSSSSIPRLSETTFSGFIDDEFDFNFDHTFPSYSNNDIMDRYLDSVSPAQFVEQGRDNQMLQPPLNIRDDRQQASSPASHPHPSSADRSMEGLSLSSPTIPINLPDIDRSRPSHPIPIQQAQAVVTNSAYAHILNTPEGYQLATSLPNHMLHHPQYRMPAWFPPPNHRSHSISHSLNDSSRGSPPGSARSVSTTNLSPALLSPMTALSDVSPRQPTYGPGYMATPYNSYQHIENQGPSLGLELGGIGGMHFATAAMIQPRSGHIRNTRGGGRWKRKTSGNSGSRRSARLVKSEAGSASAEGQDEDAEGEDDVMDDDEESGDERGGTGTHKSRLEKVSQKTAVSEQKRRNALRESLDALEKALPPSNVKKTKASTLDRATSFVYSARQELHDIRGQLNEYKRKLDEERKLNADLSRSLARQSTGTPPKYFSQ